MPIKRELLQRNAASLDLVRTAGEVPPGTWSFTVNDWAQECLGFQGCSVPSGSSPGSYRVHAHAKPEPDRLRVWALPLEQTVGSSRRM